MGSIKKILIIAVLLPLIIIGALKGYMYYKLQETMDKVVTQVAPLGILKYGGLSTSLTGRLTVKNLSFDIRGMDDTIRIRSLSYAPPNLMFLFKDSDSIKQGRLPESMQLEIIGLNMDLYGDLTDEFEDTINLVNDNLKGVNPLCGGKMFMGPREYREMGYEEITIDTSIHYTFDKRARTASITLNEAIHDMSSSYIKLTLVGFASDRLSQILSPEGLPRLANVTVEYTDKSFYQRIVKTCAEKSNMPLEEYVNAEVNQTPEYFAYVWGGIIPGPGLREAYRSFLLDPKSVFVSIDIPEDVSAESLSLFQPEDIPGLLNMQLSVNEQPVEDLSFAYFEGKIDELGAKVEKSMEEKNAPKAETKKKRPLKPAQYYRVSSRNLPKYIGKKVEITTTTGQVREGKLVRITGNTVHLERRLSGGTYDMTVSMSRIKSARVWLRKR